MLSKVIFSSAAFKDLCGMLNSGLCLVHCLAMPILITMGANFLGHPVVEVLFILAAAWAVYGAIGRHTHRRLRATMWTLWSVFALSLLLEERSVAFEWAGLMASAGLIVAHVVNLTKRRSALATT
jgi:hypothetical protein